MTGDVAQCPVSGGLLAGAAPYSVTAAYSGDTNFAGSAGAFSQAVNRAAATVAVTAVPSTGSVADAQPVSFTATVAVTAPGAGAPTGSVLFVVSYATPAGLDSTTDLCQGGDTVPLTGLTATCSFPAGLRAKWLSYTVTATLSDPNFKTPVAGSYTVAVSKGYTLTTVTGLPGSVVASQGFTFGALVTTAAPSTGSAQGVLEWAICPDPLPPSGVCTGYPGGSLVLGPPTAKELSEGEITAALTVPGGLAAGFYSVDANYQGDSDLLSSSSSNGYLTVDQVPTKLNVFANHNPVVNGGKVVLRAAVIAEPPGHLGAGGTVGNGRLHHHRAIGGHLDLRRRCQHGDGEHQLVQPGRGQVRDRRRPAEARATSPTSWPWPTRGAPTTRPRGQPVARRGRVKGNATRALPLFRR